MNAALEICPDCKVALARRDGPRHPYLGGSASCWAAYGELLAREYGDPAYMKAHRQTVDAYCAQHPGLPERRTIQSINVHLAGLCLVIERGCSGDFARGVIGKLAGSRQDGFRWLPPPPSLGEVWVTDVLAAAGPSAHEREVRRWAEAVWSAWEPYHSHVRALVDAASAR
jgi:hypothetical protein